MICLLTFCLLSLPYAVSAQDTLTLKECHQLAREEAPVFQNKAILTRENQLKTDNIDKGYYPQFNFNARATYQSDVTEVPLEIPGRKIPKPDQDQYKAIVEINQRIYDGGHLKSQKQITDASAKISRQDIETQLYQLKERVNGLYFNILLMDEQMGLTQILREKINIQLRQVNSGIKNGIILPSNAKVLKAELLKLEQRQSEITNQKASAMEQLSILLNREIAPNTRFIAPDPEIPDDPAALERPELALFQYKQSKIELEMKGLSAQNKPKINAFAQLGYGKPGLNFLADEFDTYYLAGINLSWNFWDWQRTNNEKQILQLQKDKVQTRLADFKQNIRVQLAGQRAEMEKIQQLLEKDHEIIAMREEITETASSQLNNGVIMASEYLTNVNEENQARRNLKIHELQLAKAKVNYINILGK